MNLPKLVKETDYLVAWFLFWVCATVVGFVVGAGVGAVAGMLLVFFGVEQGPIYPILGGVGGLIVGMPISYLFFRVFVAVIVVKRIMSRIPEHLVQASTPIEESAGAEPVV